MPNLAPVLLAESDADDVLLLRHAFEKVRIPNPLMVVQDGQQAIEYLGRRGRFQDPQEYPSPCLMLLTLNLRFKNGTRGFVMVDTTKPQGGIPNHCADLVDESLKNSRDHVVGRGRLPIQTA